MLKAPHDGPGPLITPRFAGVALAGMAVISSASMLALTGWLALVVLTVVVPAVWSRREQRRKDALAVLERLVRHKR